MQVMKVFWEKVLCVVYAGIALPLAGGLLPVMFGIVMYNGHTLSPGFLIFGVVLFLAVSVPLTWFVLWVTENPDADRKTRVRERRDLCAFWGKVRFVSIPGLIALAYFGCRWLWERRAVIWIFASVLAPTLYPKISGGRPKDD
jgi:hypothetical protein